MKLYIASSFSLIDQIKTVSAVLEAFGHEITCKWWERLYQVEDKEMITTELKKKYDDLPSEIFYSKPETRKSYESDHEGIFEADVLLFLADIRIARKYTGANIEFGIALGLEIPCIIMGKVTNSVMYYPAHKITNFSELITALETLKETGSF